MAGRITIDQERCKGCKLCVVVCPKDCIVIAEQSNKGGYFPARPTNVGCTGCTKCAVICPEAVIEVLRENRVIAISKSNERKPDLVRK